MGRFLRRAGWLLEKVGRVLKNSMKVSKEFDTPERLSLRLPERESAPIIGGQDAESMHATRSDLQEDSN